MANEASLTTPYSKKEPLAIQEMVQSTLAPERFGRVEFMVRLAATYDNPFDSKDVSLEAWITRPSGKKDWLPGFYYQNFTRELKEGREIVKPTGSPSWRIRYCPVETGGHSMKLVLRDRTGAVEKDGGFFTVKPSERPGLVRVSPRDQRYFEFDNGRAYFPVGANVCWSWSHGTFDYDAWLPAYAQAGCNYTRLWLSPHWTTFALERPGSAAEGLGMGQFDLGNAWRIDYVMELAARHGLQVMLCIDSYNILRQKDGYPQWDNTPHNRIHGGPLNDPTDFWSDPAMEKFYREKLRYLVARYGSFTEVMSWEFWNEVDITTRFKPAPVKAWHERMARALRDLDCYQHLITTSFAHSPGVPDIDQLPGIDYTQTHHYGSPDLALTLAREQDRKSAYHKPHYVGEIGADAGGPREKDDLEGLQIHDPLWITVATGGSGAAQSWWWDNYIHPQKLYGIYAVLNRFVRDIDWPGEAMQAIKPKVEWREAASATRTNLPPLLAWGISGKTHTLIWIRRQDRTWKKVCVDKLTTQPVEAARLMVNGIRPGSYRMEIWDTWKGNVNRLPILNLESNKEVMVDLPAVRHDVAVKMRRLN